MLKVKFVFIVNSEYISHLVRVSVVNFEQVNAGWETSPANFIFR